MSAKATGYAHELIVCPNGELISRGEKMALLVLADAHQAQDGRYTYPSIDSMAPLALSDPRTFRRHLDGLERKGVIKRLRPPRQGRGMQVFYFFVALDVIPEGWQNATLFWERSSREKEGKRGAKGGQKGDILSTRPMERAQEREREQEQKQQPPPYPPPAGGGGVEVRSTPRCDASAQTRVRGECQGNGSCDAEASALPLRWPEPRRGAAQTTRGAPGNKRSAQFLDELERDAVRVVLDGCGITSRSVQRAVMEAIRQEVNGCVESRAQALAKAAVAMATAWEEFLEAGSSLRYRWTARRFFAEGYWRNRESWPWDAAEMERQRMAMGAAVGMRRG